MSFEEIGGLKYTISADADGLKASLAEASAEVESFGDRLERVTSIAEKKAKKSAAGMASAVDFVADSWDEAETKVSDYTRAAVQAEVATEDLSGASDKGFTKVSESANKSTRSIKELAGSVTSTIGVFTGLSGAFTVVIGLATVFGRRMLEASKKTQEANNRFVELQRTLLKIDPENTGGPFSQIASQIESMDDAISDANVSMKQQAYLYGMVDELKDKLYKQEYAKQMESEKEAAMQASKELDAYATSLRRAADALVDPTASAEAEFFDTIRQIRDLENETVYGFGNRANGTANVRVAIENAERIRDAKLQHIKEIEEETRRAEAEEARRAEEKERREIEAAERTAKAAADAMERAMAPLIASLTSSFGTDFTTQLSGISNKIDDAVRELRKVKRGK